MARAIRPLLLALFVLFFGGTALRAVAQKKATPKPDPDEKILIRLREAGVDLTQPHKIMFTLILPTRIREQGISHLTQEGFDVYPFAMENFQSLLNATRTIVPELATLRSIRRDINALIASLLRPHERGSYQDWDISDPHVTGLCALLPATELNQITGQTYDPPQESVAGPALPNTATGIECRYVSKNAGQLLFIAWVDPSRFLAVHRFAKLTEFFRGGGRHGVAKDLKGVGDEAYWDERHALLVRKGRVRFFIIFTSADGVINLADMFAKEKQLIELSTAFARRMENFPSAFVTMFCLRTS